MALRSIITGKLKKNRIVTLAACAQNGRTLSFADDSFKNDWSIAIVACSNYGAALYFCGGDLQNDSRVVLRAVENYPMALEFCSNRLKGDIDVVFTAIGGSLESLRFASPQWRREHGCALIIEEARKRIHFFDIFNRLILGSVHGGGGGQSELTLLDQDTETSTYIKMLIAEYAGVPFGPQIRRARQALWNASVLAASAARGYLHLVIS